MRPCYLIAALETNHNGDLALAKRMVDELITSGVNAVKIPRRKIELYFSEEQRQQPYLEFPEIGQTYGDVLAALELSGSDFAQLRQYCRDRIDFIVAPYDLESLKEAEALEPTAYQIDPPLVTHIPLLEAIAERKRPVYAAVGMCTDQDIQHLVETLKNRELTLLHCVAASPLHLEQTALSNLSRLREHYQHPIGYLGHEEGGEAAIAAYALGAEVIEKPFTLDRHLRGPAHAVSAGREEWHALVRSLRAIEAALKPVKERRLLDIELETFASQRVSLVAARNIPAGTILERDLLAIRACLNGVSPRLMTDLVGKKALYDLQEGTPITFAMVSE
jgi:sialic acid synthase SpsE